MIPHKIVPKLLNVVHPLHDIIKVDAKIPGCPPPVDMIGAAFTSLFMGDLKLKLSSKNLCAECELEQEELEAKSVDTKTLRTIIEAIPKDQRLEELSHLKVALKSIMEVIPIPGKCLLEQNILCMGPATRAGCGSRCTKVLMPCRGCMGPNEKALDQGVEMLDYLGPLVFTDDAKEKLFAQIPLGRIGESTDVANLVAFLGSEQAGYITGQVFNVDGGLVMQG